MSKDIVKSKFVPVLEYTGIEVEDIDNTMSNTPRSSTSKTLLAVEGYGYFEGVDILFV